MVLADRMLPYSALDFEFLIKAHAIAAQKPFPKMSHTNPKPLDNYYKFNIKFKFNKKSI